MTSFAPAHISSKTILASAFGTAEREVAAMCLTSYLAHRKVEWTTEIDWHNSLEPWTDSAPSHLNELYGRMIRMMGPQFIVNGLCGLVDEEYIVRRDAGNETWLTVTDKFIEVMRRYLPRS